MEVWRWAVAAAFLARWSATERRPYSRFAAGSLGMDFLAMMDLMDFNDNR
jgi:hypothetical protein